MDKKMKRTVLLVTIIVSIAIVFVPVYFFVLANDNDNNAFVATNKKIIDIKDGTAAWDADDLTPGNDTSDHNNRVRTYDDITYTVQYTLNEKQAGTTSGSIEGRKIQVEVLIPIGYETTVRYGDEVSVYLHEGVDSQYIYNDSYYYVSFEKPVVQIGVADTFEFTLERITTTNITTLNNIKPLVFVREATDLDNKSIKELSTLPSDIPCDLASCNVALTGVESYFVDLYSGNRKENGEVPVGVLIGLRGDNTKGIRGLIVPSTINFTISDSNISKLSFNTNSYRPYTGYQGESDYKIDVFEDITRVSNGSATETPGDNTLTISINDIKSYKMVNYSNAITYFETDYFVTTLASRTDDDYNDYTITLSSNTYNSANAQTTLQIQDSFAYILGNYSSYIDVYEKKLTSNDNQTKLPYGIANINYGSNFAFRTSFSYSSRSDNEGKGIKKLINYIKVDNDVFKLMVNQDTNDSYTFSTAEESSNAKIKINTATVGENNQNLILFGFGEWNSNYLVATGADGCPTIDFTNKEQLMNLYGGPCLAYTGNVQWAYSPDSAHDIAGNDIAEPLKNKGPFVVASEFVATNGNYIMPGATGTLELYGSVVDNYTVANSSHQIVTCATALGRDDTDLRYLGDEYYDGRQLLSFPDNFTKTVYNFYDRYVDEFNFNVYAYEQAAPASGASILISGIKVFEPIIKSYRATDLTDETTNFYHYPIAFTISANATKSDENLKFDTVYVDLYLPTYMNVLSNFGTDYEKIPSSIETTNLDGVDYKIYRYVLSAETPGMSAEEIQNIQNGELSRFTIYADIDPVVTPSVISPVVYTTVDFKATKHIPTTDGGVSSISFYPITPLNSRVANVTLTLHNALAVVTKGSSTPKNIEKNGSYTFNMLAYNHSTEVTPNGYVYENPALYYVLPYDNDLSSASSSKIGTTKYKVNFTSESIASINSTDYKFYYATTGTPENIISDEINVSSETSSIWNLWEDPTVPVEDVIAIKVVKQSSFNPNTYFGSASGLTVNVETVGSNEGNSFYNVFHILAEKPDNYTCEDDPDEDYYCDERKQIKENYASSASVTSVYSREISGFVFEDSDYNGIYTADESRLKDIAVSLYKIETLPENYDPISPASYVSETDTLIASTVTGENGNYYFGGLSAGNYYVSYTIDNNKYITTDYKRTSDSIPDSKNNNSWGTLLPNTNKAVTEVITFAPDTTEGLIRNNINLGLAVKKEMAISLNKYITEVTVTRNGKSETYDYSNQNLSQVSISVLNPKGTTIRVKYSFSIENTKYYPGYVGLIVDSLPTGMTFNPDLKENQYWVMYDNLIYYNGLTGKLLLPNEKQYFTLVLDLELKQAGTYRNIVSAKDLTIMGDQVPIYDFGDLSNQNTEGGE